MKRLAAVAALLPLFAGGEAPRRVLDDFRDPSSWAALPSDGVRLTLSRAEAADGGGGGLRLDFDFAGNAGWAAIRKRFPLRLPENWAFELRLKGDTNPQTLEFKLLDSTGQNVWWAVRRDWEIPREWTTIRIRKRQVSFAWGPAGGGTPRDVAAIEIAITASSGGRGAVWLDRLSFEELPPPTERAPAPRASASSSQAGSPPDRAVDGDPKTFWRSGAGETQQLTVDFGARREMGGLVLDWHEKDFARRYAVLLSDDGDRFTERRDVAAVRGGRAWIYLPDAEARFVRIRLSESARGRGYALAEASVLPPEAGETSTRFLETVARASPPGLWPRSFVGRQLYWALVGSDGAPEKGLLSEDGALEIGRGGFSLEPFLWSEGRLLTWADGAVAHSLERGDLPIPAVARRHAGGLELRVTAFGDGSGRASTLRARYRVGNAGTRRASVRFFLAARPLQVDPPWQFLNLPGGFSPIRRIARARDRATVEGRALRADPPPSAFGAARFESGEIGAWLERGELPSSESADDDLGLGSGAFRWDLDLAPGESRDVAIEAALETAPAPPLDPSEFERRLGAVRGEWARKLDRFSVELPSGAPELGAALRSSVAWILVNRDGPALQPGSRSYARSWIRDGAMMSEALLRLGHADEPRDYLRWYAPYEFPNGKVPCCVDRRGADPVPENDSHGELLHLAAEYYRFTGDRRTVEDVWPRLAKAAAYIDELRRTRRTREYEMREDGSFFGLLPESISHEGYSARPVHSYWDDFWALIGLSDAAELAGALGRPDEARRLVSSRDELRRDLHASIRRVIARRGIDYIPGSADLADFDATSTTIALSPGEEQARLPQRELTRTFERYWEEFVRRRDGRGGAATESYTPYEWRSVAGFVRLGWRERARELLEFFLADRRPREWNEWAEVVWRDARAPKFIGDMPHGWVASDFIRSALDLFAYERSRDRALVLGAGLPAAWLDGEGVKVSGLRTRWGEVSFTVRRENDAVRVHVGRLERQPPGGVVLDLPIEGTTRATIDGVRARYGGRELPLTRLPAEVVFRR